MTRLSGLWRLMVSAAVLVVAVAVYDSVQSDKTAMADLITIQEAEHQRDAAEDALLRRRIAQLEANQNALVRNQRAVAGQQERLYDWLGRQNLDVPSQLASPVPVIVASAPAAPDQPGNSDGKRKKAKP